MKTISEIFGTIAGGASGLSRIGTMAGGQPDGFYVTVFILRYLVLGSDCTERNVKLNNYLVFFA